ncbi:MAG: hypothetical protein ACREUK_05265 [Burkholderiales bacterium]
MMRAVSVLLVAGLLSALLLRSGIGYHATTAAATLAVAYVIMTAGRLLLAATGERRLDPSAWFVAGLSATCIAVYVLRVVLPFPAAYGFGAVAALVVALRIALRARLGAAARAAAAADWRRLAGFALCAAFTYAWCGASAAAYEAVRAQGVLPMWSDYFFHGGIISQFGDPRVTGHQSIYFAGLPPTLYHFGSYAAAAALAGMLDQPGLPLALSAWLPLGLLAMLAGACMLGERLAGAVGGIAALAAVAIIPDASNYGLRNGYFSFDWTLFGHAGATYAIGAAFASLVFLDRWVGERSRPALIASALLALSTGLFRMHIFLLYFPAWIALTAICSVRQRGLRRYVTWLMLGGLAAGAIAVFLTIAHLYATDPGFWRFKGPALQKFLMVVHTEQAPTAYDGVYANLERLDSPAFVLGAGIGLAIVAALGAFVVLLPMAWLLARKKGVLQPIDATCGILFYCWMLLMLFAPVPWHGDPTDLIHRPFVLLYAAVAIWTLCLALRALGTSLDLRAGVWPVLALSAILAWPAVAVNAADMMYPKFRWGARDASAHVPSGLVEAAAYLRRHAAIGDVFAAAGLSAAYAPFDVSMQLCALSGMPAYLSRPHAEMIKDGPRKRVAASRLAAMHRVDSAEDYGEAMNTLRALHVQWYLVADATGPRWDPARAHAAFRSGTVALYAVKQARSGSALHDQVGVGNADQVVAH